MELKFIAKGKRSNVFITKYKNKTIAVKVEREDIKAKDRILNEIKFLKKLNKYKIGPKLISYKKNYFSYEYIEGPFFVVWIKNKNKKEIKNMIKKILEKCYTLDKLKINKKEFTRPIKHIIIQKNKPRFIDFERCYYTKKPKNITQFYQFLITNNMLKILKKKGFKPNKDEIIKNLKIYKRNQNQNNFNKLLKLL